MACNENVIKNMANEVTRECQFKNCSVDPDFVAYLIELLLLNPKYGKLFQKTLNRNNLEYFVNECVSMLTRWITAHSTPSIWIASVLKHSLYEADVMDLRRRKVKGAETSISTLKMQHIMQTNYGKLQRLIDKHLDSIDNCLKPLVTEILEADPELENEAEFKKLFRKISIYIILSSGLGNPGAIMTLKEGMAALESVFSLDDLKVFVAMPRPEKLAQLAELTSIVSGVRLFNRDCKKGGDAIPDLPFNLVDAGKACLVLLSNTLISIMQRVNTLTSAIEETVIIQEETGNIQVHLKPGSDLTIEDYKKVFELLAFFRQYEIFIRKLLSDVETMAHNGMLYVDKFKQVLVELHSAVKYKAAVPVDRVFPLFIRLWNVWRAMQNEMYLVSTVNSLIGILSNIQDQVKIPQLIVDRMLKDRHVVTDQERMKSQVSLDERLSLGSLMNYVAYNDSFMSMKGSSFQYLGFCAICLCVGALIPSNVKMGFIKFKGHRYSFSHVKMAAKFSKDPQRYTNEALDYARNNPYIINLLNIMNEVYAVKDVQNLVTKYEPKFKVSEKDIQTEVHPIEEHIEKNYSWNMWELKRRACQWATIVNCRTHSTQTDYSHLRSEIHCQTVEPRDKCMQTKKDCGINTIPLNKYLWGLEGDGGDGQHYLDLTENIYGSEKKKAQEIEFCSWSCIKPERKEESSASGSQCSEESLVSCPQWTKEINL